MVTRCDGPLLEIILQKAEMLILAVASKSPDVA